MNDDFNGLRTRLAELADGPAPVSTFDPARVAAVGRRRKSAARISSVGAGGALAAAMIFGVTTAVGPAADPAVQRAEPAFGIGADPLSVAADFGWLPASLRNVSYVAQADTRNDVIAQADKSPGGAQRVDLQVLPGDSPGTPTVAEHMIAVTLNDGRGAFWVTQAQSGGQFAGDFQLRFPTKSGRWAVLTSSVNWSADATSVDTPPTVPVTTFLPSGTPPTSVPASADWQQTLLRIATQVTDTPAQHSMPFVIAGLPPSLQPRQTILWRPGQFGEGKPGTWSALLTFSSGDASVTLEVTPHNTIPKAGRGTCKTSAGLDACVEEAGKPPALDRIGGAKGLLSRVILLGTDEGKWTTSVLVP